MFIDIKNLQGILDEEQINETLNGYFHSYCYNDINENDMYYETIKEMGFITTYKKKEIIDLEELEKYDHKLFLDVLSILLNKYIFIDGDIVQMDSDDILKQFEEETEEDFYKNTEDLNVLTDNYKLLYDSMSAKSLEKYGIIKIKNKNAIITDKIQDDEKTYAEFVNLSLIMIADNGEEYNPTVFDYLKTEGIIKI